MRFPFFNRRKMPDTAASDTNPAHILSLPEMPAAIYAVGDVHGMRALYSKLEARIISDAEENGIVDAKLILLLGDIVDRGPDSAGLIDDLLTPAPPGFQRLVLRGNHEDKMRAFLNSPGDHREWLGFGGDATLTSYGLQSDPDLGVDLPTRLLENFVRASIPEKHHEFLKTLPYGLRVGDYFFCHAGIDPSIPLHAQHPNTLLWGDPEKIDWASGGLPIIVHGHVPVAEIFISKHRINVDTGAYMSGKLSAVRFRAGESPVGLSVHSKSR